MTFDGCSRAALRMAHREIETVNMRSDEDRITFSTRRIGAAMASIPSPLKSFPWTASTRTSSCSALHQSTTESARPALRGDAVILETFGGLCRNSTLTTSPPLTPTRHQVSREMASEGGEGDMVLIHKITTYKDDDCRVRSETRLNGNVHFDQVRPPSVPGICSSWDLLARNDYDGKSCISFSAREI